MALDESATASTGASSWVHASSDTRISWPVARSAMWASVPITATPVNGAEVDLIVEDDSGSIAGVEVKAASTVSPGDVKHLQGLRDKLGVRFTAGVVLYLGERVVPLGERIWALPVSMLWAD